MSDEIIKKVWETSKGQKHITIPKKSNIKNGDLVSVKKVEKDGKD